MKKFLLICLAIMIVLSVCSCGNMGLGIGSYTFTHIYVDTDHYSGCLDVEKWQDNSTGIEVETETYGAIFFSEGTYILVEEKDTCPFCSEKQGIDANR